MKLIESNRIRAKTRHKMDQGAKQKPHVDLPADSKGASSGENQSVNSDAHNKPSTEGSKSVATDRWLEEEANQEYWNTMARLHESKKNMESEEPSVHDQD